MYNQTLAELREISRDIAKEEGAVFAAMSAFMAKGRARFGKDYIVCPNGGNPERAGSLVIASVFLKALGCDGNIGTITVDLGVNKAEATDGHKILSCTNGQIEVESARYPFCFFGEPNRSDSTRSVPELIPFNEDLNRLRLIVRQLGGSKAKVTWGSSSKEFSAAQLEQGINLAAEFLDNPFSAQFKKVDDQMFSQQWGELQLIKERMNSIGSLREYAPNEKESLDRLSDVIVKTGREMREGSVKLVTPVRHILQIEAIR
jgi:hypothetical protein